MTTQALSRSRDLPESASRAGTLLGRYPNLSERELAEMIQAFRQMPLLYFTVLSADERWSGKLDTFYRDHGEALRPPVSGLVWITVLSVVAAIGLLVLL